MKKEKIRKIWKIVLIIDLIPIVGLVILAIYNTLNGFWLFMTYYERNRGFYNVNMDLLYIFLSYYYNSNIFVIFCDN